MEEELAGAIGPEDFSIQFEKPHEEDTQSEKIRSDLTPPVEVESAAVENEPTTSTTHPQTTPSPEPQPSARNSGIMQSRWANAPDEPVVVVVEPNSEVTKDATSLEQGVNSTPSRNRRGRGTNHSKKDSTQSVRSGRSSLAGSPKKSNRESGSKRAKGRSTSTQGTERAHITTPLVAAHTSPKIRSISPSKPGSSTANHNPPAAATAVASGVDRKIEAPVQIPESSPSKNEISKSRWA